MNILIAGGNGFIGKNLAQHLEKENHKISILTRNKSICDGKHKIYWDAKNLEIENNFDVIINLCGKNISESRWSNRVKQELLNSRINPTKTIINFIETSAKKTTLINASAIGIYSKKTSRQDETSNINIPPTTFSEKIVQEWESCSQKNHTKTINIRLGAVLGKGGGIIQKILPLFKIGLGSVIGNNKDKLSWIHIDDVCEAISFIIKNKNPLKTYNLTSPESCTQKEFANAIAKSCHKKCFLKIPPIMIKLIFGQMGEEIMLGSLNIYPKNLEDEGFIFKHQNISQAIKSINN